jgi:predicted DNA-binding transcriptional regulator YafY
MVDYILNRALENHQEITIMYIRGSEITERKIKIRKIENDNIEAYCYLRHQIRHFKKENILSAMYTH